MATTSLTNGKYYVIYYNLANLNGKKLLTSNSSIIITGFTGNPDMSGISRAGHSCINITFSSTQITFNNSTSLTITPKETTGYIVFKFEGTTGATLYDATIEYNTNVIDNILYFANGLEKIPCPYGYDGSTTTLVDSARNIKGFVVAEIVRSDIAKINLNWNFLTPAQYSAIAKRFDDKYGGNFYQYVIFYNSTSGYFDVRLFYPNDRAFETAKMTLKDNMPYGFSNISLHLIEV